MPKKPKTTPGPADVNPPLQPETPAEGRLSAKEKWEKLPFAVIDITGQDVLTNAPTRPITRDTK